MHRELILDQSWTKVMMQLRLIGDIFRNGNLKTHLCKAEMKENVQEFDKEWSTLGKVKTVRE